MPLRFASLARGQTYSCSNARDVTLIDMGKSMIIRPQSTQQSTYYQTMLIFIGMYCIPVCHCNNKTVLYNSMVSIVTGVTKFNNKQI